MISSLSHPLPDIFPPLSTFSLSLQLALFLMWFFNLVEKSQKNLEDQGDVVLYV